WTKASVPGGVSEIGANDVFLSNGVDGSGNPVAYEFPEGANIMNSPIYINYRDSNITPAYKTLSIDLKNYGTASTKERKVYVIPSGSASGGMVTINAWSDWSLAAASCVSGPDSAGNIKNCQASLSMTQAKHYLSDADAFKLSSEKGFLLPVEITDQAGDSSIPVKFRDLALKRVLWIYGKAQVKNNAPVVKYFESTPITSGTPTPTPVPQTFSSGMTLRFQTGKTTEYTIRIIDSDYAARVENASPFPFTSDFTTTLSAPGSSATLGLSLVAVGTPAPLASPSPGVVQRDYKISLTPTQTGLFSEPSLTITDPGDPAKANGRCGSAGCVVSGSYFLAPTAPIVLPFRVRIDGKPFFVTQSGSYDAYLSPTGSNGTFTLPISVKGSRNEDILGSIFVGLPYSVSASLSALYPAGPGPAPTGKTVAVNPYMIGTLPTPAPATPPTNLLAWYTSGLAANTIQAPVLYAINKNNCSTTKPSGTNVALLIRFNGTTVEPCYYFTTGLPSKDYATNGADPITLTLKYTGAIPPGGSAPSIGSPKLTRTSVVGGGTQGALQKQECTEFQKHSALRESMPVTCTTGSDAFSWSSAYFNYDFSSTWNSTNSTLTTTKRVTDPLVSDASSIELSAYKGETMSFSANLTPASSAGTAKYTVRWYVNGCVRDQSQVSGNQTASFNWPLDWMSGGRNDLCPGTFTNPVYANTDQSVVSVSLVTSWGDENLSLSSGSGTQKSYTWKINVINQNPVIVSSSDFPTVTNQATTAPSPIPLGNVPLSLMVPAGLKNYLVYAQSTQLIAKEFNKDGTLGSTLFTVNCGGGSFSYLAVEPPSGSKGWTIAATSLSLTTPAASSTYTNGNSCVKKFSTTLPAAAVSADNWTSGGTSPDVNLLFTLKYNTGMGSVTRGYANGSTGLIFTASGTGAGSGTSFTPASGCSSGMTSLFCPSTSGTPSPAPAEYQYPGTGTSYSVKNTVSNSTLSSIAQAMQIQRTGGVPYVRIVASQINSSGKVTSMTRSFTFAPPSGPPSATLTNDIVCNAGSYYTGDVVDQSALGDAEDQVVVVIRDDTNKLGRVYLLRNVMKTSGTGSCSEIGQVNYPKAASYASNTRLVYDSGRDLILGAVSSDSGDQLFTYDLIRGSFSPSPVPSAISTGGLLNSILSVGSGTANSSNSVYILPKGSATTPLYKVW
ncbi:MAG: hypothetical protein EBX52_03695, partial [Proteobacteria bacterium]|nr:hypothetical protein [Pseudomonadota bacterium]